MKSDFDAINDSLDIESALTPEVVKPNSSLRKTPKKEKRKRIMIMTTLEVNSIVLSKRGKKQLTELWILLNSPIHLEHMRLLVS